VVKIRKISVAEQELLKQHYKKANSQLVRERAHAILLSSDDRSAVDIASILLRTEKTIRGWLHDFNEAGVSSIFTAYTGNVNASKLTKEQKQEIQKSLQQPPNRHGIPKEFWDIRSIRTYIRATFGVVYESKRSYHFLLQLSNLSFKLPSKFDVRRDDKAVEQRMQEIREEIAPMLKDDSWAVLVSDEVRIMWESEIRRAWLKKGEKTVLKVHRSNEYQNYIGMLNLNTHQPHLYAVPWQNQETIINALEKLEKNYPNKRICLIWDNARWHKGKDIRKQFAKGGSLERFHCINFPPYAPDKNPQENIWNCAKDKISNICYDSFDETKQAFRTAVMGRKYAYDLNR
jgi:transposase